VAEELPIYRDANIEITNLRAMLHDKTYAMANVTSVSMFTQQGNQLPGIVVLTLASILLLMAIASSDLQGCFLIIALILLIVGIAYVRSQKDRFWVRIGSASGETNALSSYDRAYILHVVNAMNEAIVRRG
jgi:hypothetical protein